MDPSEATEIRVAALGLLRVLRPTQRRSVMKRLEAESEERIHRRAEDHAVQPGGPLGLQELQKEDEPVVVVPVVLGRHPDVVLAEFDGRGRRTETDKTVQRRIAGWECRRGRPRGL